MKRFGLLLVVAVVLLAGHAEGAAARAPSTTDLYTVYRGGVVRSVDFTSSSTTIERIEEYAWAMMDHDRVTRSATGRVSRVRRRIVDVAGTYISTDSARPEENRTCRFSADRREVVDRPGGAFIRSAIRNPFVFLQWVVPTAGHGIRGIGAADCGLPLRGRMFSSALGPKMQSSASNRALSGMEKVKLSSLPFTRTFADTLQDSVTGPDGSTESGRLLVNSSVTFTALERLNANHVRSQLLYTLAQLEFVLASPFSTLGSSEPTRTLMPFVPPKAGTVELVATPAQGGAAVLRAKHSVKARKTFDLRIATTPAGQALLAKPRPARRLRLVLRYDPAGSARAVTVSRVVTVPARS